MFKVQFRSKRPLRTFILGSLGTIIFVSLVALVNRAYAVGILLSCVRSEIAMTHWMGVVGLSRSTTVLITTVLSTGGIYNTFWCAENLAPVVGNLITKIAPKIGRASCRERV